MARGLGAALGTLVLACGGTTPPPAPSRLAPAASVEALATQPACEELLARLNVLIAACDDGRACHAGDLAEARALRDESVVLLATGDDALARELLTSAIALLEGAGR